jgi:agmatine/peptidylarginine deiminase
VWLDFRYSEDRQDDDSTPGDLAAQLGMPLERHDWWLDGGAVLSNGKGLCVITDVSVGTLGIPGESSAEYDRFLRAIGCQVLAVIPALPGEETGHADVMAQFLDEGVIAIAAADRREAPRAVAALDDAVAIIRDAAVVIGQDLEIIRLPMRVRAGVF